jgi:Ca2+-binding EF-hand superfamily protein
MGSKHHKEKGSQAATAILHPDNEERVKELFHNFDKNADGALDKDEWKVICRPPNI